MILLNLTQLVWLIKLEILKVKIVIEVIKALFRSGCLDAGQKLGCRVEEKAEANCQECTQVSNSSKFQFLCKVLVLP